MKKILEWGAVCFLALFLSVMPVQASEPTVTEDTGVSAEGEMAKGELILGTFGVNNGLSWIYDSGTKILTISGKDVPNTMPTTVQTSENGYTSANTALPWDAEVIQFTDCVVCGNMDNFFVNMKRAKEIDLSGLTLSNVTSMKAAFRSCSVLESIDITGIDTSEVTSMSELFAYCGSLKYVKASDLDTGKVTDMSSMFLNCSKLEKVDLSGWNTKNVKYMYMMFDLCQSLTGLDISSFDTGNVEKMSSMFAHCVNLTELDLRMFDTGNVKTMHSMFEECQNLKKLYVGGWNTQNVTDVAYMFENCMSLESINLRSFDLSKVTAWEDCVKFLQGCDNLKTVKTPSKLGPVTLGLPQTFADANGLVSLVIDSGNLGKTLTATELPNGIRRCAFGKHNGLVWEYDPNTKELVITGEDTTLVRNRYRYDTRVLENDTFPADVESVRFEECTIYDSMYMLFCSERKLKSVDLSGLHCPEVYSLQGMFSDCSALKAIDLSSLNFSCLTNIQYLFGGCSNLTYINLANLDFSNIKYRSNVFSECTSLNAVTVPANMGDVFIELPANFYYVDDTVTTVMAQKHAGTTLYREGFVPEKAKIVSQPVSVTATEGEQVTFRVGAVGNNLKYEWRVSYKGEETFTKCYLPGSDTSSLTFDASMARDGYRFRCVVINEAGRKSFSEIANLTVKAKPALGVSLKASQTNVNSGDMVTFTAQGNGGDGNYQYKFIINDTTDDKWYLLQGYKENNTIEWKATTPGTKRIMVDVMDGTGAKVGKNVSVVVNPRPELSAVLSASAYTVSPGDKVTLTAQGVGGSGKYNYKFIVNDKTDDKWYKLQDYCEKNEIIWTATTPGTKRLMVDVMDSTGKKFGTNVTIIVEEPTERGVSVDEGEPASGSEDEESGIEPADASGILYGE